VLQNAASGDIRERSERGIEAGSHMLNHSVQYATRGRRHARGDRARTAFSSADRAPPDKALELTTAAGRPSAFLWRSQLNASTLDSHAASGSFTGRNRRRRTGPVDAQFDGSLRNSAHFPTERTAPYETIRLR
jgi:hypothetical protein